MDWIIILLCLLGFFLVVRAADRLANGRDVVVRSGEHRPLS